MSISHIFSRNQCLQALTLIRALWNAETSGGQNAEALSRKWRQKRNRSLLGRWERVESMNIWVEGIIFRLPFSPLFSRLTVSSSLFKSLLDRHRGRNVKQTHSVLFPSCLLAFLAKSTKAVKHLHLLKIAERRNTFICPLFRFCRQGAGYSRTLINIWTNIFPYAPRVRCPRPQRTCTPLPLSVWCSPRRAPIRKSRHQRIEGSHFKHSASTLTARPSSEQCIYTQNQDQAGD